MLPPLIEALRQPGCYPHPAGPIELVETHISWVLLTGEFADRTEARAAGHDSREGGGRATQGAVAEGRPVSGFAYKIKKPVDLGFLDFSTLAKRRHYCEEELRLNRRLAPQLYLEVVPITGTEQAPRIGGDGEAFEYAVKMRQFDRQAQLDRVLARGELKAEHIDSLALALARFHAEVLVAGPDTPYGEPVAVLAPMQENFEQIRPRANADLHRPLARLQQWTQQTYERLAPVLAARKREGFVRECHGDAHLANMALINSEVVLFDCLEFNANLRWIDVMSELAFAAMDLTDRGRDDLAWRLVNGYLEHTGDYAGVALLRFYQVYRALVRAKVAAIRLGQTDIGVPDRARAATEVDGYLALAQRYTRPARAGLVITHGLSGSGKTTMAQALVESLGAIRVRSDVERKRLHGMPAGARSGSGIASGLYAERATEATYAHLAELARVIVQAGVTAVIDATFLKEARRRQFAQLARNLDAPFVILSMHAPESVLRERIVARAVAGRDASEAGLEVLAHQLAALEPVTGDEQSCVIEIDTQNVPAGDSLARRVRRRLEAK